MAILPQGIRFPLRQLWKAPGFTVTAVLTLALGIGANTAVFSVLNALLLRMLPVRDPAQLYIVKLLHGGTQPPNTSGTGNGNTSFSFPVFEALRGQSRVFSDLIAHVPLSLGVVPVRFGDTPLTKAGEEVSGNYFTGLGVPMALGEGLTAADEQDHAAKVVISYGFWTQAFSRDPAALGKTLWVKGVPMTIVGVTAPQFFGVDASSVVDFWVPLQTRPELSAWGFPTDQISLYSSNSGKWWAVPMVARLAPGLSPEQASRALQAVFWQAATSPLGTVDPKRWPATLGFTPIRGIADYAKSYREPVEMMMALVGLVLLIACTNVSLLILARCTARQREFAIRVATGASAGRIFRQLLTESVLLVASGAALGWGIAIAATRVLAHWARIDSGLAPDRRVLLFTLAVASIVAITFSLAPFARAMGFSVEQALRKSSQMVSQDRRRARMGSVTIALQIGLCFTLLVAAGLTVRSLENYESSDLGMRANRLLVFDVTPQDLPGDAPNWIYYSRLMDRIRAIPGVADISVAQWRPGSGWLRSGAVKLDGALLLLSSGSREGIPSNAVGPDFFRTLGIPLLEGREFTASDSFTSPWVEIVNEEFARRYLKDGALGHIVDGARIVGVVGNSKYKSAAEPVRPTIYQDLVQMGMRGQITVEVRTTLEPMALLPEVRRAVREVDPNLALQRPMTQAAQLAETYTTPMLFARLSLGFGVLAVVLVATGLYGTLTYRLQRRRGEIGVRMALGALRSDVLRMIFNESLGVAALGFGLGLPLAMGAAYLLRSQLFGVKSLDWPSFVAALVITLLVAVGSTLIPARQAARIDPMEAIRTE